MVSLYGNGFPLETPDDGIVMIAIPCLIIILFGVKVAYLWTISSGNWLRQLNVTIRSSLTGADGVSLAPSRTYHV